MSSPAVAAAGGGEAMKSASAIVAEAVTGSHVLKIEGYSGTKVLGNGESIKSSTFALGAHRWFIRYYPDGNGSENAGWISFYLDLNLQHSDATSVKASFKFSLLDEMGQPVPSYSQPWGVRQTFKASGSGSSWGYERFIEKKALEQSTYLKDDCFSVQCDVIVSKGFRAEDTARFVTVPPSDLQSCTSTSAVSSRPEQNQTSRSASAARPSRRTGSCSPPGPRCSWRSSSAR